MQNVRVHVLLRMFNSLLLSPLDLLLSGVLEALSCPFPSGKTPQISPAGG